VVPGVTGWLAQPGDNQSLAESLAAALALSASDRAELARAAQEQVRRRYDLAQSNQRLLALLERVRG
jgi:glycosyltransferase involved in cell wall biosynthesis